MIMYNFYLKLLLPFDITLGFFSQKNVTKKKKCMEKIFFL